MTTPEERTMAVFKVQAFLKNLMLGNYPRVSKEVRAEARRMLKHYPMACDLLSRDAWDQPTVQKWAGIWTSAGAARRTGHERRRRI